MTTSQKFPVASTVLPAIITLLVLAPCNIVAHAQNYPSQKAASQAPASTIWKVVKTPNIGFNDDLLALSADSTTDIWAVGQLVSLRFNGTNWTAIPMAPANSMNGVAALSPSDVWAVGMDFPNNHNVSVIQHFDGNQWSIVASPHFAGGDTLNSVQAISANDIFAVGTANADLASAASPLVEHFDGSTWSVVSTPLFSTPVQLNQLAIISATDMWAVGVSGTLQTTELPFAMHFDGTEWKQVSVPAGKNKIFTELRGVTAIATNDVWAVGFTETNGAPAEVTLTEHWDGTAWSIVPSPNQGASGGIQPENQLFGVSAISSTDVWACGFNVVVKTGNFAILIEHWDGKTWTVSPSPQPQEGPTAHAVLAFSSGDVLVGGSKFALNGNIDSVILHTSQGKVRASISK